MRPTAAWIRTGSAYAIALVLAACLPATGHAQALGPRLQDAAIEGHGDTLTIRRLPVRTPGGTVYRDITIQLRVDDTGALRADAAGGTATLRTRPAAGSAAALGGLSATALPGAAVPAHDLSVGSITETATVPEVAAVFRPGRYRSDSGALLQLHTLGNGIAGTGIGGGFPSWQIGTVIGDTPFSSAEWYAGPIRTSPYRGRLRTAGIADPAYSYGVVDGSGAGHFDAGMLVGAKQVGDQLTIVSFHRRGCCTYADTPTSAVTYTWVGN